MKFYERTIVQILLDLDGVLVDFMGGIHRALGGPPIDPWQWTYNKWEWYKDLGWTFEQMNAVCTFDFWANLKWTPDGHDILREVYREQLYFVTCPMPNIYSASGKMAWIRKNLPLYESQIIVSTVPKEFFAAPDRLLIDDKNENVDEFEKAGGKAILINRPWNRGYKRYNFALEDFIWNFKQMI